MSADQNRTPSGCCSISDIDAGFSPADCGMYCIHGEPYLRPNGLVGRRVQYRTPAAANGVWTGTVLAVGDTDAQIEADETSGHVETVPLGDIVS